MDNPRRDLWLSVAAATLLTASSAAADAPTFHKDVLPILQQHCQVCHRPGEVAPMSLLSYEETRPWARAIRAAVSSKTMPPWFADPAVGHFANERRLTRQAIETIQAWADAGAPAGPKTDAPPAIAFPSGWNLSPDLVVEMPKPIVLPARGTVNYQYVLVKTTFKQDLWVAATELRAGNPRVVHHAKVWVRPPGSPWMADAMPGVAYELERHGDVVGEREGSDGNEVLGKFNPGLGVQRFDIDGAAKFVPKGSDLVFELHYTTSGAPASDVSKLGLVLARDRPRTRYYSHNGPLAANLRIPAGAADAEVVSEITVRQDVRLVYAQPHMHLRGKDFELRLVTPAGRISTLLKGTWNVDWQIGYEFATPVFLPRGTKLQFITHFDNSPRNRLNPDPSKAVVWGRQNWDEMSNCWIGVLIPAGASTEKLFARSGPSQLPRRDSGPTRAAFAGGR